LSLWSIRFSSSVPAVCVDQPCQLLPWLCHSSTNGKYVVAFPRQFLARCMMQCGRRMRTDEPASRTTPYRPDIPVKSAPLILDAG